MPQDNDKPLSRKHRVFAEEYIKCWNASEAARRAGYNGQANIVGPRLLSDVIIRQYIDQRVEEIAMSANEVWVGLSSQARSDIGVFFKVCEEWTFDPLPSHEIIGQKEVIDESDPDKPERRISYWVRHIALDMDKVTDPQYSHLIQEFTDNPKEGLGIKLYNKQAALQTMAKWHGKLVDKHELSGKDGEPIRIEYINAPYPTPSLSPRPVGDSPEPQEV
jgi:hypothetical protein